MRRLRTAAGIPDQVAAGNACENAYQYNLCMTGEQVGNCQLEGRINVCLTPEHLNKCVNDIQIMHCETELQNNKCSTWVQAERSWLSIL